MPIEQSDPYKVQEICHLRKQPRAAEALELLKRVALQVQPIMRKRQWTVRKLSEFVPKSNNLLGLNVNRGAEVKIRLRPPGREDSFYPWEHVLGTMLHELCHNNIGPHNAVFYKLLDELWSEAEDLMDRGVTGTGQGFDAASAGRLGSHSFIPTHNPPEHRMADAIRKAAEARAQKAALVPAGPQKLGGSRIYNNMTPAQAAAAAAERRARDNMWCGAEHTPDQVKQEVGSRDASPAVSTVSAPAAAASVAAGQSQAPSAAALTGAGSRVTLTSVSAAGSSKSASAAAGGAAAAAGQMAVEQQQKSQQDSALQQQWQARLQRQQQQRQQTSQRAAGKRTASESIDLTLSDDEDDSGQLVAGNAAGAQPCSCPSCDARFIEAAATDGAGIAAAAAGGGGGDSSASLFRVWCAQRRQWFQNRQLSQPKGSQTASQADAGTTKLVSAPQVAAAVTGEWSCPVCTLLNRALALQCEACFTLKPC